jgi:hypothetical protein
MVSVMLGLYIVSCVASGAMRQGFIKEYTEKKTSYIDMAQQIRFLAEDRESSLRKVGGN